MIVNDADIVKTEKITPTGIILLGLSLCLVIILGMTASWAHGVDSRQATLEGKEEVIQRDYGTVNGQLQDLREAQRAMDAKLDRLLERGR